MQFNFKTQQSLPEKWYLTLLLLQDLGLEKESGIDALIISGFSLFMYL